MYNSKDKETAKKLKRLALTYLFMLVTPFLLTAVTSKAEGRVLFLIVWPLISIWYFFAYRRIAKHYQCTTTKLLAFSYGGGGSFSSTMYSLASFILLISMLLIFKAI